MRRTRPDFELTSTISRYLPLLHHRSTITKKNVSVLNTNKSEKNRRFKKKKTLNYFKRAKERKIRWKEKKRDQKIHSKL